MSRILDMVELIEFLVFLLEIVVGLIRWLWKLLVWLLGPLGAGLGLIHLLLLPWFHSGGVLLGSAVFWGIWIVARQVLRFAVR